MGPYRILIAVLLAEVAHVVTFLSFLIFRDYGIFLTRVRSLVTPTPFERSAYLVAGIRLYK